MSWKGDFADKATEALNHELVTTVKSEFVFNMEPLADLSQGLPAYGLEKVMRTVAIVSAAYALGIDPDSLRLTKEEADEAVIAKARAFVQAGVPTLVIGVPPDAPS